MVSEQPLSAAKAAMKVTVLVECSAKFTEGATGRGCSRRQCASHRAVGTRSVLPTEYGLERAAIGTGCVRSSLRTSYVVAALVIVALRVLRRGARGAEEYGGDCRGPCYGTESQVGLLVGDWVRRPGCGRETGSPLEHITFCPPDGRTAA
jgi:hypothetical protein